MAQRIKCEVCGRSWDDSVAFRCYRKPEKTVCMYCCVSKCRNGYRDGSGGVRCKVFDRKKAESEAGKK